MRDGSTYRGAGGKATHPDRMLKRRWAQIERGERHAMHTSHRMIGAKQPGERECARRIRQMAK